MNNLFIVDLLHSPTQQQWKKIEIKHHHGIAIPLFSLHTTQSCGIGEFLDLIPLIDWCHSIGYDVIQLLPLNDSGRGSSPYSAQSAFALNPIYLSLHDLPYLKDYPSLKKELAYLSQSLSHFNKIHYSLVMEKKLDFFSQYLKHVENQIKENEDYVKFIQEANFWLKEYVVYKILMEKNHFQSWENWPLEEQSPTPHSIEQVINENPKKFLFYSILQFLCDQQLRKAKEYASLKQVFIMGDIPILIDRNSADVWYHRHFFELNFSAGAPPDMYSEEGQNWGFPLYHWESLSRTNYQWWRERLKWANRYYHIYRIDHIVGFFRIWSIPIGKKSKEGKYHPLNETIWIEHGKKILSMMIDSCEMLPIGEDLGTVPPEARVCLRSLGICGTKVMRWERKWHEENQFINVKDYPLLSLTTVGTHDSETLQIWWRENIQDAKDFSDFKGWVYQPILSREHHREILWDSHHSQSLFHVNPLQEYFVLVRGLSWPNLEDERINLPGTFSNDNWSYKLKPSIEELASNQLLMDTMRKLIQDINGA
ncbi:MAG: 4-alpha-glucanotransferase [Parachlamydiaceae bacterium]|nr:4-alpha-glucanotransferase [Parachlamydiaceae bacterium]